MIPILLLICLVTVSLGYARASLREILNFNAHLENALHFLGASEFVLSSKLKKQILQQGAFLSYLKFASSCDIAEFGFIIEAVLYRI